MLPEEYQRSTIEMKSGTLKMITFVLRGLSWRTALSLDLSIFININLTCPREVIQRR